LVSIKQVIFSFILPFIVLVIVPSLILWLGEGRTIFTVLNSNLILLVFGFIVLGSGLLLWLDCVVLFYKIGKGTLFPSKQIETKSLVIVGPYKYVRNPMIIGVIITSIGESFIFSSRWILIFSLIFFGVNIIYMPLSEEKGLVERFGEEYLDYRKQVRGWIPKFHAYSKVED
jgi:protein-S-isoprenylcysteine O-methyltransferase Ste14